MCRKDHGVKACVCDSLLLLVLMIPYVPVSWSQTAKVLQVSSIVQANGSFDLSFSASDLPPVQPQQVGSQLAVSTSPGCEDGASELADCFQCDGNSVRFSKLRSAGEHDRTVPYITTGWLGAFQAFCSCNFRVIFLLCDYAKESERSIAPCHKSYPDSFLAHSPSSPGSWLSFRLRVVYTGATDSENFWRIAQRQQDQLVAMELAHGVKVRPCGRR